MKEITIKSMLDNGDLLNEEKVFLKDGDKLIIELKTDTYGNPINRLDDIDYYLTIIKQTLESKDENIICIPDTIKLKVLSIN